MSVGRLLLREIHHRVLSFVLGLIAVVVAVALAVAVLTMCDAADQETTRLMRNMGFNVLIVPKGTDMGDFWSEDFARKDMPEEYVHRLAQSDMVTIRHLVARLQSKIEWRQRKVLLTGILPEVPMMHLLPKSPMGLEIPDGTVYLGHEVWRSMGISEGDTIELGDRSFVVGKCLAEKGGKDDIRIYGHLHDVQRILGMPGRINEIEALSCQCTGQRFPHIREDLARALPDTYVTEYWPIAEARTETRRMMDRYAAFVVPAVVLVSGLWVGLLALSNVRERRGEIGILRALGVGSGRVALLFMGKAIVLGLVGGGIGFALGTGLALHFGPQVFPLTANKIAPLFPLLPWSLAGAPVVCAVAAYLPAMLAVMQDPAVALREE